MYFTYVEELEEFMRSVAATDFVRNFSKYQDDAREEAVEITSHGRATAFLISPTDYAEYLQLRAKSRRVLKIGQLPMSIIDSLRESEMSGRHDHLNSLMDD
jgi:prevent-host-death family protein